MISLNKKISTFIDKYMNSVFKSFGRESFISVVIIMLSCATVVGTIALLVTTILYGIIKLLITIKMLVPLITFVLGYIIGKISSSWPKGTR